MTATNKVTGKATTKKATDVVTDLGSLTEDSIVYQKAVSLVIGLRDLRKELLDDIKAIQAANPGNYRPRGVAERQVLVEAVDEASSTFSVDVRRTAKSSGLSFPEGV